MTHKMRVVTKECYYCGLDKPLWSMLHVDKNVRNLCNDCHAFLLKKQNHRCAICGSVDGYKRLCLDHCHETLTVRGLLCQRCNTALGLFNDDERILARAIVYLMEWLHDSKSNDSDSANSAA
jgi:hypothetical protein